MTPLRHSNVGGVAISVLASKNSFKNFLCGILATFWKPHYLSCFDKKCAKWAQGYENDIQRGPKRPQMVLKGRLKWSQSGTRRSLKGPQTYKQINKKHVVENWRAFCHVDQCLSKWNLQAE